MTSFAPPLATGDGHSGGQVGLEQPLEFEDAGRSETRRRRSRGRTLGTDRRRRFGREVLGERPATDRLLHHPHRPVLGGACLGQLLLQRAVRAAEQRLGVTCRQPPVGQEVLHCGRQRHQPQRVGDRRAALADAAGDLLVGQAEVLGQLLERGRLLQRSEILAVEVLHQRPLDRGQVVGGADDRRDERQPGSARRSPAALAGNELIAAVVQRADEDGLEHADLADRGGQLGERLLVEVHPRLVRVGQDAADGELLQPGDVVARGRTGLGRDQRPEAPTKSAQPRHR